MAYQALYRQWRPRDFSHMVGQEAILETLRHQVITGRIAHAYLFCGSRGTGKTSTAKILARAMNCLNPRNGDPCGECEMCRKMTSEDYLDILEFDAASNSRVEDARELLEKVNYPPQFGSFKVFIIDEVHMLSNSAFNALLKTLEEPPDYMVFILATTEPYRLPATILSRCQRFDFGRIPASKIQGRLREAADAAGTEASDGALMAIARAAEGGMRDALSILDMCLGYGRTVDEELVRTVLGTSDRDFLFRFSRALRDEDAENTVRMIDELIRGGRDPLVFSRDISSHLRTLIMAKYCGEEISEILDLADEDTREYLRESEGFTASRLMDMLDLFMRLETELRYSTSPRIALENTSLKCCLRTKEPDTLALHDRIAQLEGLISELQEKINQGIVIRKDSKEVNPLPSRPLMHSVEKKQQEPRKKTLTPAGLKPDEIWKEVMKRLQKEEPGTFGMLTMGSYQGSDGTEYRWKASPAFGFATDQLNSRERRSKLESVLTAVAGIPCTFKAEDSSIDIQKNEDASDEEYLQELRETFGDEPVDVAD